MKEKSREYAEAFYSLAAEEGNALLTQTVAAFQHEISGYHAGNRQRGIMIDVMDERLHHCHRSAAGCEEKQIKTFLTELIGNLLDFRPLLINEIIVAYNGVSVKVNHNAHLF